MTTPEAQPYLTLDTQAHRCPDALFRALRAQEGIHRDPSTGFHLIVRPDTIRTVLLDPDTYSSADALSPALTQATHALMGLLSAEQRDHFVSPVVSIMTSEGATHQRLRKAVNPYFTAHAIRRRFPSLRARAAAVLDRMPDRADWVQDFCMPFTIHAISDLLGVPDADHATVIRWDDFLTSLAAGGNVSPEAIHAYLDFTKEFTQYFRARTTHLAQEPDDSLLTHLIQQGDSLTDHERIQFLLILFPAGSTTTVILLTHIALRLARQPELLPHLRAAPETVTDFIEECVVERSPSANVFRTTTRDVTLQNTHIPAGSHLLLLVAAANQSIDDQSSHLAFGTGLHRCLGAQLARAEARAALEEILERYTRITVTHPLDDLPFRPHLLIPSHPHLPVHVERRNG